MIEKLISVTQVSLGLSHRGLQRPVDNLLATATKCLLSNQLGSSWWLCWLSLSEIGHKNRAALKTFALVGNRLLRLPVVYIEDTDLSVNTCRLLSKLQQILRDGKWNWFAFNVKVASCCCKPKLCPRCNFYFEDGQSQFLVHIALFTLSVLLNDIARVCRHLRRPWKPSASD